MMHSAVYQVSGMTCDHCVQSVRTELGRLPSVRDVTVDLAAGAVTVASDGALATDAVRAAIDEAGFTLVAQPASDARRATGRAG
jgi:copper chaperone CopZ